MKTNIRTDSWAAALTEDQRWQLYYRSIQPGPWTTCIEWAKREFKVEINPSTTAFYNWKKQMRQAEHEHHMEEAAIASAEAAALAGTVTKDEALIAAYKSLGIEAALKFGDAKSANAFVQAAVAINDRLIKERELELKSLAQRTKDQELALAREKFEAAEKRLNAASETVGDEKLSDAERVAKLKSIFGLK